jgi:hypothetical protein
VGGVGVEVYEHAAVVARVELERHACLSSKRWTLEQQHVTAGRDAEGALRSRTEQSAIEPKLGPG